MHEYAETAITTEPLFRPKGLGEGLTKTTGESSTFPEYLSVPGPSTFASVSLNQLDILVLEDTDTTTSSSDTSSARENNCLIKQ